MAATHIKGKTPCKATSRVYRYPGVALSGCSISSVAESDRSNVSGCPGGRRRLNLHLCFEGYCPQVHRAGKSVCRLGADVRGILTYLYTAAAVRNVPTAVCRSVEAVERGKRPVVPTLRRVMGRRFSVGSARTRSGRLIDDYW